VTAGRGVRIVLFAALALLYVLHADLWFWNDAHRVLGLPVGLVYHVLYCFAAAGMMALLVRFAWPTGLENDRLETADDGGDA